MTTEQRRNIFIDQGTDFYQEFEYPDAQAGDLATAQLFRWFGGPLMATFSATVNIVGKTVELALAGVDTAKIKRSGEYNIIIQNGSATETLFVGKAALRVGSAPASSTSPPYPIGQYSATKDAARLVATSNITLSGLSTIDGVTVNQDDRVLVVGQTDKTKNGLYSASSGTWRRSGDADTSAEMVPGFAIWVAEGTWNGDSLWELTTDAPIVLGTTELVFTSELGKPAGLASSASLTTEVLRAEAAEAGKQPLDANLTTIASFDSAQSGVIASDGAGWIRKSYSALKSALGITAADIADPVSQMQVTTVASLNIATADTFDLTLTAASCAITFTNAPTGATSLLVILRQDATGGRVVTWPGSVTWIAGSAPKLRSTAQALDFVQLTTTDGVNWYGFQEVFSVDGSTGFVNTAGIAAAMSLVFGG